MNVNALGLLMLVTPFYAGMFRPDRVYIFIV